MSKPEPITVSVRNFGPIEKGSIDLRPLTVLSGLGNTGKSWIAGLLYTLFERLTNERSRLHDQGLVNLDTAATPLQKKLIENPMNWIESIRANKKIVLSENERRAFESIVNTEYANLEKELCHCLGFTSHDKMIRWRTNDETVIHVHSETTSDDPNNFSIQLNMMKHSSEFRISLPYDLEFHGDRTKFGKFISEYLTDANDDRIAIANSIIAKLILDTVYRNFFSSGRTLFVPSVRVGLMNNFRSIVQSALHGELDTQPASSQGTMLRTGISIDFLQNLIGIPSSFMDGEVQKIACGLEKEILGGKIIVEHDLVNFPYFSFVSDSSGEKMPLSAASSTVSQLAPLVLFLRYFGERSHTIIIEEPEIHLHPVSQVKLVREIGRLVNIGYRVIITTHSEFVVTALCNLVIEAENQNGFLSLHPDNVGFWRFDEHSDTEGTIVNEVIWDLDQGGYDHRFDRVSLDILNTWLKERQLSDD